jgi:hypothetical protein
MPIKSAARQARQGGLDEQLPLFFMYLIILYPLLGYASYRALFRLLMDTENSQARVKFLANYYVLCLVVGGIALTQICFASDFKNALLSPALLGAVVLWASFFLTIRKIRWSERFREAMKKPSFWFLTLFTGGGYISYLFSKAATKSGLSEETVKGGSAIFDAKKALLALCKIAGALGEGGIKIHPELKYPKAYENKHILLVSTVGSGKTQAIFPMVESIRERRERMVIYDRKGDFTEAFGEDEGVVILSPFDKRSVGWDAAADISSELLAEEFSSALIPLSEEGRDQVWIEAARDIFAGVMLRIMADKPGAWSFSDLMKILDSKEEIISSCKNHRPGALMNLGGEEGEDRQSAGIFMCLRSSGSKKLRYLSKSWDGKERKFSIKKWISDEEGPIRTIIIRGHPRYKELDDFMAAQIYGLFFSELSALSDSPSRRIWAVIDELGNLPKIPRLTQALAEYRSKGLAIIGAIQDIGQIRARYGKEEAQAWFTAFSALLAGRVGDPETAGFLSKAFGQVQLDRTKSTYSAPTGSFLERVFNQKARGGESMTYTKDRVIEPLLLDSEFLHLPHASLKDGAIFWLRVGGWPAARLKYPVIPTAKRFAALVQEEWV